MTCKLLPTAVCAMHDLQAEHCTLTKNMSGAHSSLIDKNYRSRSLIAHLQNLPLSLTLTHVKKIAAHSRSQEKTSAHAQFSAHKSFYLYYLVLHKFRTSLAAYFAGIKKAKIGPLTKIPLTLTHRSL